LACTSAGGIGIGEAANFGTWQWGMGTFGTSGLACFCTQIFGLGNIVLFLRLQGKVIFPFAYCTCLLIVFL